MKIKTDIQSTNPQKIECKYRLCHWQKTLKDLESVIETLVKYRAPYEITQSSQGYAVFVPK